MNARCGDAELTVYRGGFSRFDFAMVADEQIQKWADGSETGYNVEELQRRGRGRAGRGAEPMQVVAVRLTAEEIAALDAMAEREHLTRSETIRRALADSCNVRSIQRTQARSATRRRRSSGRLATVDRTLDDDWRIASCGSASTPRPASSKP
jgi:predicted transcriptional regulator